MAYIIFALLGIPVVIWGIFIEKKIVGKIFGVFGLISIIGFGLIGYNDINQIASANAQINFNIKLNSKTFRDSTYKNTQQGSMSSIEFINKEKLILAIPSRFIIQEYINSNLKVNGQFDSFADTKAFQINGNIKNLKKSDRIQLKIPEIYPLGEGTIENGSIELILNGNEKIILQIPPQIAISSDTIVIPIEFP